MKNYLQLLEKVLMQGHKRMDRTGVGTRSLFAEQLRFDLSAGLPVVTTKKIHLKSVIHELLWFLSGSTDIKYLQDNGVRIWDEWGPDLGPIYGHQWRHWAGDQVQELIEKIRYNPTDRRMILSAWNRDDLPKMALPPCHLLSQYYVRGGTLSCQVYQRSADLFLGVPFNIASYAILTHLLAHVTGLRVGELIMTFGDVHIYNNHIRQCKMQLDRKPLPLPKLVLRTLTRKIDHIRYEDIEVMGYRSHPAIRGEVAV